MKELFLKREGKGKAKIVYLWTRYRRTIAVAAFIAGLVSISTATIVSMYSEKKKVEVITPLVDHQINQIQNKLKQIEIKLNDVSVAANKPAKPKLEANFRATGFLVDGNGYIITNAHVVNDARNIIVENKKGDQFFAKAVYVNKITDLAILKISDTSFKKLPIFLIHFQNLPQSLANIFLHWVIRVKKLFMAKDTLVQNQVILVILLLTRSVFQ